MPLGPFLCDDGRARVSSDTLQFELTDKVAVITLNRPEVRNAMNAELREALLAALHRVRAEADIRAAIITGAGGTFSAGADLKERARSDRSAATSVASQPSSTSGTNSGQAHVETRASGIRRWIARS